MITTVCLNPAIDENASVDCLRVGEVNRLRDVRSTVAGKGINVAIVLRRLQADAVCVSCVGDADAAFFAKGMERERAGFCVVAVPGSVRRNLKIISGGDHTVTELNGPGAEVGEAALSQLTEALKRQAENSLYIALCGSLPPGCGENTYRDIMRTIPGKRWIVDTSGAAMRCALKEKPFLIKPNLPELEEIAQMQLKTPEAIRNAAMELCNAGVAYVAVSLGAQGALLTDGKKTLFAPAVPVPAVSAVGAGDSMLAGMLYAMERGETAFEALRSGTAAGAACVRGGGIHAFDRQVFTALLSKAEVREI